MQKSQVNLILRNNLYREGDPIDSVIHCLFVKETNFELPSPANRDRKL